MSFFGISLFLEIVFNTIVKFRFSFNGYKRGSLLGNEEVDLGGDSPIFEIIIPNLEQRSIFAKKSTHFSVIIKISLK